MKNQLLLVLAVMLSIVAATPANAQRRKAAAINRAVAKHVKNPVLVKDMDNVSIYSGKEKGFVLVSKSEKMPEVLGYGSNTLSQENMPDGMKWLLGYYDQLTEAVEAGRVEAPAAYKPEHAVEPLLKTQWAQDAPFWDMLPTVDVDGVATPTVVGCTATAMAQIMKHYCWPERGQGSVSYYCEPIARQITADLSESVYDWDNMLDYYGKDGAETEAQRKAVALLSRDAGYAIKSLYNTIAEGGTSGTPDDVCLALVNNFGYDKGLRKKFASVYTQEEWAQMLYDEFAAGRPVQYFGFTHPIQVFGSGHSFILDGMNEEGLYHVNWGWRGSDDNYFYITALNPDTPGIGAGNVSETGGYNYNQVGLFGFQKPVEGSKYMPYILYIDELTFSNNPADNTVVSATLKIANSGYDNFKGVISTKLVNEKTQEELDIAAFTSCDTVLITGQIPAKTIVTPNNSLSIPDGEYTFRCYSTDMDGNVERCVNYKMSAKNKRVIVKDNKFYYAAPTYTVENFSLFDVDHEDTELNFKFRFDAVNNSEEEIPATTLKASISVFNEADEENSESASIDIPVLQPSERYQASTVDENVLYDVYKIQLKIGYSDGVVIFKTDKLTLDGFVEKYSGSATAINAVTTASGNDSPALYNIMGQRITAPQHGLYIKNGKVRVK